MSIPLNTIQQQKRKQYFYLHKTCTWIFIAALFRIAETWNLEAMKVPCSRRVVQWTVVPPDSEVLSSSENKRAVTPWKDRGGEHEMNITELKEQSEMATHCIVLTTRKFRKRQNCGDSKKPSGLHGGV